MKNRFNKYISLIICITLAHSTVIYPSSSVAQNLSTIQNILPPVGAMIGVSSEYTPTMIRGLKIDPIIPFRFQFLLDSGDAQLEGESLEDEASKLIRYFLASLTIPEKDMWVNLSPYENDRIIPESFGKTEMGIDLLEQDYILKQLSASMFHPHHEIGKKFWREAKEILALHGLDENELINTFNKVWIVPESGYFVEENNTVYLKDAKLKVLIEDDFVALQKGLDAQNYGLDSLHSNKQEMMSVEAKELIKKIIIPAIEVEVNEGRNFAKLRQIYNAMLLSVWFKKRMKEHVISQQYSNQMKIDGIDLVEDEAVLDIWQQYVESFNVGVYNLIEEEYNPISQKLISRKYFSGGATALTEARSTDEDITKDDYDKVVDVGFVDSAVLSRGTLLKSAGVIAAIASASVLYYVLSDLDKAPESNVSLPSLDISNPNISPIPTIADRLDTMSFNEISEWVSSFEVLANDNVNNITFDSLMDLLSVSQYIQPNGVGFNKFRTNQEMTQQDFQSLLSQVILLSSNTIEKIYAREESIKGKTGHFISHIMKSGDEILGVTHSNRPNNYGELITPLWDYIQNLNTLNTSQKTIALNQIRANLTQLLQVNIDGEQEASYAELSKKLISKKSHVLYVEETEESLVGSLRTLAVAKQSAEALRQAGFSVAEADKLMLIILDNPFYFAFKNPLIQIEFLPAEVEELHSSTLKLQDEAQQILEDGDQRFATTGFSRLPILTNYLLISGEYVSILNYNNSQLQQFYANILSIIPPEARTIAMAYLQKRLEYWKSIRARDVYLMSKLSNKSGDVIRGYGHVYTLQVDEAALDNEPVVDRVGGINLRSDQAIIHIEEAANGFQIPQVDASMLGFSIESLSPHILQIHSVPAIQPLIQ